MQENKELKTYELDLYNEVILYLCDIAALSG